MLCNKSCLVPSSPPSRLYLFPSFILLPCTRFIIVLTLLFCSHIARVVTLLTQFLVVLSLSCFSLFISMHAFCVCYCHALLFSHAHTIFSLPFSILCLLRFLTSSHLFSAWGSICIFLTTHQGCTKPSRDVICFHYNPQQGFAKLCYCGPA